MDSDPYVSAVVRLRGDEVQASDGPTVADPHGVVAQAAAVLEGAGSGPTATGEGHAAHDHTAHDHAAHGHAAVAAQGNPLARAKGYFTRAGFEVHAPLGHIFSIGANQAHFERFFGQPLVVAEDRLGSPVTVEGGGQELSLTPLSEEIRATIENICLPSPPELF